MSREENEYMLDLFLRTMAGDLDAGREFLDEFRMFLKPVIRRFITKEVRTLKDSDDFVEDTLVARARQYRDDPSLENLKSFVTYAKRLARNLTISAVRQASAAKRGGGHDLPLERAKSVPARGADPEQIAQNVDELAWPWPPEKLP